jgi:transcriptional regulator with XRE-family HTH domain
MSIGERLRQIRVLHGTTLQELADNLNISISTLSRIESGVIKDIKFSVLNKLITHFHISYDMLIYGDYYPNTLHLCKQIISNLYTLLLKAYEDDNTNNQHKIKMIDLPDESTYEFIKILFESTGRKDIPKEIIPYIIGVKKRRVIRVFEKYKL